MTYGRLIPDYMTGGFQQRNPTQKWAKQRKSFYTEAELILERILNTVNFGVLKGKFHREWAFGGKWILDFYFWEDRIGIEVDGGYHSKTNQKERDRRKEAALIKLDIILVRLKNEDVFGERELLLEKLRDAWRKRIAKRRPSNEVDSAEDLERRERYTSILRNLGIED